MAQRMIHYAVANELIKTGYIKDDYRFCLGSIIPDSHGGGEIRYDAAHFVLREGTKKNYDFTGFFNKYKEKIVTDDLYLGYYIHIITDVLYRKFIYDVKGLKERRKEVNFKEKLYSDYHNLNYVIRKEYNLDMIVLDKNSIPEELGLSKIDELEGNFREDFNDKQISELNYITYEILKEFMGYLLNILSQEIASIRKGNKNMLYSKDYWY